LFRNTPVLRASLDAGSNGSVESVSSKTIRLVCFAALSERIRHVIIAEEYSSTRIRDPKVVHPDYKLEETSSKIDWRFRQLGSSIVD
jgi:hypothetical protein